MVAVGRWRGGAGHSSETAGRAFCNTERTELARPPGTGYRKQLGWPRKSLLVSAQNAAQSGGAARREGMEALGPRPGTGDRFSILLLPLSLLFAWQVT